MDNLNLSVRQLGFNNFSNEGVGITFSRTSSDADLMAIGVVDTSKLNIASRSGLIFSTGGGSTYAATSEVMRIDSSGNVVLSGSNPYNYNCDGMYCGDLICGFNPGECYTFETDGTFPIEDTTSRVDFGVSFRKDKSIF